MKRDQFMYMTSQPKQHLWLFAKDLTEKYGHRKAIDLLLAFRRGIQEELSRYAAEIKIFDERQRRALWATEMILRWCKDYYMNWARRERIKSQPSLALKQQKLDGLAEGDWEKYVRKYSY